MKKKYWLLLATLLVASSCNNNNAPSSTTISEEVSLSVPFTSSNVSEEVNSSSETISIEESSMPMSEEESIVPSTEESIIESSIVESIEPSISIDEPSISEKESEEPSVEETSTPTYKDPTGTNPDGGGLRMPLPLNLNDKYTIGHDNASITTFNFENSSLPKYFRYIHGNNFTSGNFYADGSMKISSSTAAKQGFQTGYFVGDKKLEIRIHIGNLYNSNDGKKIDKNSPVISIYGFKEDGTFLQASYIDEVNKNDENNYVKAYMNGNNVSYLEVRFMQLPYKGSQAYNASIKGLSLIAWPYEYNG